MQTVQVSRIGIWGLGPTGVREQVGKDERQDTNQSPIPILESLGVLQFMESISHLSC